MHDPLGVRVVEGRTQIAGHRGDPPRAERAVAERAGERLARHVLHHDQHALVLDAGVENSHQVRVVQGGAELRLADEAALYVSGTVGVQALDRHLAPEPFVAAQEHGGHPARAEVPTYAVATS